MPHPDVTPESLASALVARLIHDAMGPASGIVSAFDLIADPGAAAMRDEALALAAESARKLVDMLVLSRAIYAGGTAMTAAELRVFAERLFDGSRATLTLQIDVAEVSAMSGRLLLGLLQLAVGAVAAGGAVTARLGAGSDRAIIEGSAKGTRLRVGPDVLDGLAGRGSSETPLHRWSAAYLLSGLARSAGWGIEASVLDGTFVFRAVMSAEIA